MVSRMSQKTQTEVLAKKHDRYARAGQEHKIKTLDELVELFDYHRKAAIRALLARFEVASPFVLGRPKEYDLHQMLSPLKAIWLAALQPCGARLKACLPDWRPAYEEDHRRLNASVRKALLEASRGTLDRLLIPARIEPPPPGRHASGHPVAPPDSDPHRVVRVPGGLSGDESRGVVRRHAR